MVVSDSIKNKLVAYLDRQKKHGKKVELIEKPYSKPYTNIRAIVSIDGLRTKMIYSPKLGRWRKA